MNYEEKSLVKEIQMLDKKRQDYVYGKGGYGSTWQK